MTGGATIDADYTRFIVDLKARVAAARLSAARAINRELISLYWDIGKAIVDQQLRLGWGKSVVEQIARDLRTAFPGAQGFSARNVWDMRRLYDEYTGEEILRQVVAEMPRMRLRQSGRKGAADPVTEILRQLVAEVPWGHHLLILNKLDQTVQRLHYLRATAAFGWSRNVLLNQIKAKAFERSQGGGKVELKVGKFEPEYAGKMDFYLNLLNEKERGADDSPSIGIILCAEKDNLEVEFALKSKTNPISVAEYQLQAALPASLRGKLPTPKQLEEAMRGALPGPR